MKIAVTYDRETGSVFQHFGRTEFFKIYETENNQIVSVNVHDNAGVGHEALADVLKDLGVDILVCGGMGPGAQAALAAAGLTIYAGIQGSADEAVVKLLKGELPQNDAANCDHHDHEHHDHHEEPAAEEAPKEAEEEAEEAPAESEEAAEADTDEAEGCDCGEDCGEGCGGGCSGCGPREPIYEGKNAGKTVKVHFEKLCLYASKPETHKTLQNGDKIEIVNDISNIERALLLLKDNGVLSGISQSCYDESGAFTTFNVNNPNSQVTFAEGYSNCSLTCIQESNLPSSLGDYDFGVLPGNTALQGLGADYAKRIVFGEKVTDETLSLRANGVAVRKANKDGVKSKAIVEAFATSSVREYISKTFGESVVYHYESLI